jgi:hypothetical protein
MANTSTIGTFAIINFTAQMKDGISPLRLSKVEIGSPSGIPLPFEVINGRVKVILNPWDVNRDGKINVLDMIFVAQHWMETGNPGWMGIDVNKDGIIDILDLIFIGQNWTG